jgi:similar to stage IV sporulation protein
MLIPLWNFLRGYVVIEVAGFSVERFVNLAVHRGLYIWDLAYQDQAVTMKVSAKAFKLLRGCARKTGCKIKILRKQGWPFFAFQYRKRKILAAGVALFVAALYALSSFVWLIEVEGAQRVAPAALTRALQDAGLRPGAFKYGLDTKGLEKAMLYQFTDLAWIDIYLKGTTALVRVAETLPAPPVVDRLAPCDIVAAKDGLVVSVVVSAGTPLVKPLDVVRKGSVLVSGRLAVTDEATGQPRHFAYIHAEADITAKLYYEMNFNIPYAFDEKKYTGRQEKKYRLQLLGHEINLFNAGVSYENYDKIITRTQLRAGAYYPLPVAVVAEEYREFTPQPKTRTPAQAKELAEWLVNRRLLREFDPAATVTDQALEFAEGPEALAVTALISTLEHIGQTITVGNE